jgi:aspartate racemase
MGPEATAEFFRQLIELTPAEADQDHVPVIIISDPRIPDRTDYILGVGDPFLPDLLRLARTLEKHGADFIVMPCNTAHLFWQDLCDAVDIPVLNIVEETISEILAAGRGLHRQIGVLATIGTLQTGLYQTGLERRGLRPLVPSESTQRELHQAIKWVKAKADRQMSKERIELAVESLREAGADGVILGCTELSLVAYADMGIPLFDSLKILVNATLQEAFNKPKTEAVSGGSVAD